MGVGRIEFRVRVNAGDRALLPIRTATRLEATRTAEIIYIVKWMGSGGNFMCKRRIDIEQQGPPATSITSTKIVIVASPDCANIDDHFAHTRPSHLTYHF